jgi:hypothetical protein
MIKVNLADRKTSTMIVNDGANASSFLSGLFSKAKSSTPSASLGDSKALVTSLALYGLILGGAYYGIDQHKTKIVDEVNAQNSELQTTIAALDVELAKSQGYEQMKQGLENDEKMLKNKIDTIQKLMNDRTTPPKVLIALSEAIPKQVWLTNFTLQGGGVNISGAATTLDTISDFMKALEGSIYFKDITLKGSKQGSIGSRESATFELEAKRR